MKASLIDLSVWLIRKNITRKKCVCQCSEKKSLSMMWFVSGSLNALQCSCRDRSRPAAQWCPPRTCPGPRWGPWRLLHRWRRWWPDPWCRIYISKIIIPSALIQIKSWQYITCRPWPLGADRCRCPRACHSWTQCWLAQYPFLKESFWASFTTLREDWGQ